MVCCIKRDVVYRRFFGTFILLLFFLTGLFLCIVADVEGKGLHVTVVAPWTETPFLQEGCEFAATRTATNDGFYSCLRDVWQHLLSINTTGGASALTQKSQYDVLMRVMESGGLTAAQLKLLAVKLAARVYSPAVEAHWQLARESSQLAGGCAAQGGPFALIAGRSVCDAQRVEEAVLALTTPPAGKTDNITEEAPPLFADLDHIHPESRGNKVVILYGIVGEERTMELFYALQRHLKVIRMSFRHLPVIGPMWNRTLYVQGYGVKANLRNVEYKALDDEDDDDYEEEEEEAAAAGGSAAGATFDKTNSTRKTNKHKESFGGVGVPLLEEQYFQKEGQLNDGSNHVRDNTQQETGETVEFVSWEAKNMGFILAKHVMSAPDEKRLKTLLEVLTKLSVYSTTLFKNDDISYEARDTNMLQEMSWIENLLARGMPSMFFDGCPIDIKDRNIFYLLQMLDNAEQTFESIEKVLKSHSVIFSKSDDSLFSAPTVKMHKIVSKTAEKLYRDTAVAELNVRFWILKENIFWFNNIETDPSYANMPDDIFAIMETGFNNMPVIPRKNLFNVVCVVDPTTTEGLKSILMLLKLLKSNNFFRFGVLFADKNWSPEVKVTVKNTGISGAQSLSTTTASIAATIWELFNGEKNVEGVLLFLNEIIAFFELQGEKINEYNVEVAAQNILSKTKKRELQVILGDPNFVNYYQKTEEIINLLGLEKLPSTILNGKISYGDILQTLYSEFNTELNYLRQLVNSGLLSNDDTNLYETIMQVSGAKQYYRASLYNDEIYMDWTSLPVLDFLYHRLFILPASYSGKAALLSGVLVFKPPTTFKVVRAIKSAIKQLVECQDDSQKCSKVRLTYVFCGGGGGGGNTQATKSRTFVRDLERLLLLINIKNKANKNKLAELVYDFLGKILAAGSNDVIYSLDDAGVYENLLSHVGLSLELQELLDSTISPSDVEWYQEEEEKQRALVDGFCAQMEAQSHSFWTMTSDAASNKKTEDGTIHYYVNGRLFQYQEENEEKEQDDFVEGLFAELTVHDMSLAADVFDALTLNNLAAIKKKNKKESGRGDLDSCFFASKVAALSGFLRQRNACDRLPSDKLLPLAEGPASFSVRPVNASAGLLRHKLMVFINPSAPDSQLLASLCDYFIRSQLDVSCNVYLTSTSIGNNKPVRNFYQFVADTEVRFDSTGAVLPPAAVFHWLPSENVLTLAVEEPEGWLVFSLKAAYDLDNIVLAFLPETSHYLHATYQIKSFLVFGNAKDSKTSLGAHGLPLVLRSFAERMSLAPVTRETFVMDSIGYFQLQGLPGVWYISVRPGDAAKAFYISKVDNVPVRDIKTGAGESFGSDGYMKNQNIPVVVSSFEGKFMQLTVARTPGNELKNFADIMQTHPRDLTWPPKGPSTTKPERPTLNIFSVVSGHLYERFLRMVMHSVMQTSSDIHGANTTLIKFWLIENFLSPKFRTLVPLLAKHYGFEVGFMSYRWPWWLHKQVEKQRTIWAYKILFLDVLFPFDVDRVIFVDADQKTFVDMHELYNMDIGGAPMAYTPFCRRDPNKATWNFRFWESGFWFDHLNGKPYHISALYLVDLQRLRAIAGCEKYRSLYSGLSKDPGNLANLDQDLPNYIQDDVPIYSLPEEWLWCESWCGSESKPQAKTIDLCNNPITKMSKLDNAKMVIPGWEKLDAELGALSKRLLLENKKNQTKP